MDVLGTHVTTIAAFWILHVFCARFTGNLAPFTVPSIHTDGEELWIQITPNPYLGVWKWPSHEIPFSPQPAPIIGLEHTPLVQLGRDIIIIHPSDDFLKPESNPPTGFAVHRIHQFVNIIHPSNIHTISRPHGKLSLPETTQELNSHPPLSFIIHPIILSGAPGWALEENIIFFTIAK